MVSWAEITALTDMPAVVSSWWKKDETVITFKVQAPILKPHAGGITIGSIVEGSDAEPIPKTLYYPFTEAVLQSAIARVENAVNDIIGSEE